MTRRNHTKSDIMSQSVSIQACPAVSLHSPLIIDPKEMLRKHTYRVEKPASQAVPRIPVDISRRLGGGRVKNPSHAIKVLSSLLDTARNVTQSVPAGFLAPQS